MNYSQPVWSSRRKGRKKEKRERESVWLMLGKRGGKPPAIWSLNNSAPVLRNSLFSLLFSFLFFFSLKFPCLSAFRRLAFPAASAEFPSPYLEHWPNSHFLFWGFLFSLALVLLFWADLCSVERITLLFGVWIYLSAEF